MSVEDQSYAVRRWWRLGEKASLRKIGVRGWVYIPGEGRRLTVGLP